MNISEVLIKLRDDIKLWVENNIETTIPTNEQQTEIIAEYITTPLKLRGVVIFLKNMYYKIKCMIKRGMYCLPYQTKLCLPRSVHRLL